ncbi:MAG: hypothetical protein HOG19_18730 [Gammaproteobacteria bacterium]|jgi:hypothetical protein|nr:hypothetical protein [Gammaproteobacteria bacterium]
MPGSFTVTTLGLQSATLEMDGGTKPGTTDHYLIKRKPNGTPFAIYLVIYKTTEATVYDHPRSRSPDGTLLNWDYVAYSYITATSSYDSGIAVTSNSIQPVTTAQITSTGIAEPTTSGGTISNTYLAQAETAPSNTYDKDSWTVTKVIPLAASSA